MSWLACAGTVKAADAAKPMHKLNAIFLALLMALKLDEIFII
jgi:hypothetical protein